MSLRFASTIATAAAMMACTAGSGSLVTYSPGARDDPGSTGDTPPSTRDNPTGACIACDVNYDCTGETSGIGGSGIELSTSNGTCVQSLIDVICSGALFNATGCSGGGGGPFTCGDTTCSPGPQTGITTVVTTPVSEPGAPPASGSSSGSPAFEPDAG